MSDGARTRAETVTRREALSAIAAVGGLSLAGCTAAAPLGRGVNFESVAVPTVDDPWYRRLVPAGSALPEDAAGSLWAGRPERLPEGSIARGLFVARADWLGTAFESYERVVSVGPAVTFEGSTDPATVAGALEGTGYAPAGSYRGYDLYDRDDAPRTVAAGDGAVVLARGESRSVSLETLVDAREGQVRRRHEVDDDFAELTAAAGASDFDAVDAGLGAVRESVAAAAMSSAALRYADDATYLRSRYLFETPDDIATESIRRELREGEAAREADAVDVWTAGRLAVVDVRTDPATETPPTPLVTWGVSGAGRDAVTLRHEAGETVKTAALVVRAGESDASVGLDGTPQGPQFRDEHDTVGPGDELRVPVESDDEVVRIGYLPTDRRRSRLFSSELPPGDGRDAPQPSPGRLRSARRTPR